VAGSNTAASFIPEKPLHSINRKNANKTRYLHTLNGCLSEKYDPVTIINKVDSILLSFSGIPGR
jgi:hypothetical protein